MKEITREQAEELFQLTRVLDKKIEQTKTELMLSFSLSNQNFLHIVYNTEKHLQKFFLENPVK